MRLYAEGLRTQMQKKVRDICPIELGQRFSDTLFSTHKMQQFSQCKLVQTMQRKMPFLVEKLGMVHAV